MTVFVAAASRAKRVTWMRWLAGSTALCHKGNPVTKAGWGLGNILISINNLQGKISPLN